MIARRLAAVLLATGLLLATVQAGRGTPMDDGSRVIEALQAFVGAGRPGATMRLDGATDFPWDRVHGFAAYTTTADMRRVLGRPDFRPTDRLASSLSESRLLVFLNDGEVVRQVVVEPPLDFAGLDGRGYAREEAVLTVHGKDPGPYMGVRFAG